MSASAIASEQRCIVVDQQCRESEGKAKIEGYMRVSDEEAHHQRSKYKSYGALRVQSGGKELSPGVVYK